MSIAFSIPSSLTVAGSLTVSPLQSVLARTDSNGLVTGAMFSGLAFNNGVISMSGASPTAAGAVMLASNALTASGIDTGRAVVAAGLKYTLDPIVNARAPRQGVVFAGINSTVARAALTSDLGTSVFTLHGRFTADPAATPTAVRGLFGLSPLTTAAETPYGLEVRQITNGALQVLIFGATLDDYNQWSYAGFGVAYASKTVDLVLVRNAAGNPTIYINGTDVTALGAFTDSGAAPTWQGTVTSTYACVGYTASGYVHNSAVFACHVYNRALTATEVQTLFEIGVPAASDYGSTDFPASASSMITGDNSTFASAGTWSLGGAANIAGGVLNLTGGDYALCVGAALAAGKRYRVVMTVTSNAGQIIVSTNGVDYEDTTSYVGANLATGTLTKEFTMRGATDFVMSVFGGTAVIDSILLYPIGVMLAPDPLESGVGLQWHDMSGNRADILLPASGVSWAIPNGRRNYLRGRMTWAGTNEIKSVVGDTNVRCLPNGVVITDIVTRATAGSAGLGLVIQDNVTTGYWVARVTYTTAKKRHAVANYSPGGTTTNYHMVNVAPDDQAYTGTIDVEVHYIVTEGTP